MTSEKRAEWKKLANISAEWLNGSVADRTARQVVGDLVAALREAAQPREAERWEADHQRRILEHLGLAEEFPCDRDASCDCDVIGKVGEALLAARAQVARANEALAEQYLRGFDDGNGFGYYRAQREEREKPTLFTWGAVEVGRFRTSDRGHVWLTLNTPRQGWIVKVTPSGLVRVRKMKRRKGGQKP